MEPLLPHLNPGDAFSSQVRVDGGELATDGVVVDDLFDGCSYLLPALNAFEGECSIKSILPVQYFRIFRMIYTSNLLPFRV